MFPHCWLISKRRVNNILTVVILCLCLGCSPFSSGQETVTQTYNGNFKIKVYLNDDINRCCWIRHTSDLSEILCRCFVSRCSLMRPELCFRWYFSSPSCFPSSCQGPAAAGGQHPAPFTLPLLWDGGGSHHYKSPQVIITNTFLHPFPQNALSELCRSRTTWTEWGILIEDYSTSSSESLHLQLWLSPLIWYFVNHKSGCPRGFSAYLMLRITGVCFRCIISIGW